MGLDGKKFSLVIGLKPDQQGIGSATVSAGAEERGGDAAADPPPHSVVMGKHPGAKPCGGIERIDAKAGMIPAQARSSEG
jgi:hypothetical protein